MYYHIKWSGIANIHNKYCIYKSYIIDHNYHNNKTVLNINVPSTRDNTLHRAHKPVHRLRLYQEKTNTQKSSKRLQLVDKKSNDCFDKRTRLWWCLGCLSRFSHLSVWWDVQFQIGFRPGRSIWLNCGNQGRHTLAM